MAALWTALGDPFVWLLAVSVSMDTFALSLSLGLRAGVVPIRGYLRTIASFAGIQTLFLWAGSLIGDAASRFVTGTSWIVCVLLVAIGGWMIRESLEDEEEEEVEEDFDKEEEELEAEDEREKKPETAQSLRLRSAFAWKLLLTLGVAESIDAIGVGASLGLSGAPIAANVTSVFLMTALACVLGLSLGGTLGDKWKKGAGILGGIILIALGIKQVLLG